MCGLIGYIGKRNAGKLILNSLKLLEYRGYDSVGIATLFKNSIDIRKGVGNIEDVNKALNFENMKGNIGIGHTRWSTHGKNSVENAHPHSDCKNEIYVVHNGIIENYKELKNLLKSKGHVFKSETDTEVIPHLIENFLKEGNNFINSTLKCARFLKGEFSVLILSKRLPNCLIAFKKGSPLVVGYGKSENFISSDQISLLKYTNKFSYLDDHEFALIKRNDVKFFNFLTFRRISKRIYKVNSNHSSLSKENFKHFMLKEIKEQPISFRNSLIQEMENITKITELIKKSKEIFIVACGTSYHASLIGSQIFLKVCDIHSNVILGSEFNYMLDNLNKNSLIIAVSQSGETADVLFPIKKARKKGCNIVSIVNVPNSSIDRESNISIYLNAGPEISVASTKAFTSQLAVFYLLAFLLSNKLKEIKKMWEIPLKIQRTILKNEDKIRRISRKLKDSQNIYYIGRGINFPIAMEGSLKMKEISYIHSEGMSAGELKHGTLSLISKGTPVVAISPRDYTYNDTISNIIEAKSRGAYVIGISNENNEFFDEFIEIPKLNEIFYPILAVIPCQLLAYYTALYKGNEIDKPRNLAKCVTVR